MSREIASEKGLTRYYTGEACKRGHVASRYTRGGQCVTCTYLHSTNYRKKNPEKFRGYTPAWRRRNPEKAKIIAARSYRKNREKIFAKARVYREANRDKMNTRAKVAIRKKEKAFRVLTTILIKNEPRGGAFKKTKRARRPKKISREEARKKGLIRFYTGKPCKRGHLAFRRTKFGICVACSAEDYQKRRTKQLAKYKERRKNNLEKARAYSAAWRENNRERTEMHHAKWRKANPDKIRMRNRRYRSENLEKCDALVRKYRENNPEATRRNYIKQQKKNRDKAIALRALETMLGKTEATKILESGVGA